LVYAMVYNLASMPAPLEAQTLSNNTLKVLSENNISVKDNVFYTPVSVSNNFSVMLQLAGGPWGAVAGAVFSLISSQLASDQSNQRFDQINRTLQQIQMQLRLVDAKLDRIDLALRLISDKDDEILASVDAVPDRQAFRHVLSDISYIQDHWESWTKSRVSSYLKRSEIRAAYDRLDEHARDLYEGEDPTYTPTLAIALGLQLDLAKLLAISSDDVAAVKKGYRRFLEHALASGAPIKPGEPVMSKDSFPVRLAKRRALIRFYLKEEYGAQTIVFNGAARDTCIRPWGEEPPLTSLNMYPFWGNTSAKDSFIWDPPLDSDILLRLIRVNATGVVAGPIDNRLWHSERSYPDPSAGDSAARENWRGNAGWVIFSTWDLVAAVRSTGVAFDYLGAYYRPNRIDNCSPIPGPPRQPYSLRFGVLTSGDSPKTPEDFFNKYGTLSDHELDIFTQQNLIQTNRQVRLMAIDTVALAATSEFRAALDRAR